MLVVSSFLLRYEIEIIPPDTHIAENKLMYSPVLLLISPGFVIKRIPEKPINIKSKVEKFIFSENMNDENIHAKNTFVNPIVLA